MLHTLFRDLLHSEIWIRHNFEVISMFLTTSRNGLKQYGGMDILKRKFDIFMVFFVKFDRVLGYHNVLGITLNFQLYNIVNRYENDYLPTSS